MSCSPMNGEVRRLEPLFERDDRERQRARARGLRLMVGRDELERFQPVLGEHMAEALARAVAPAGDDHVQAPLAQRADMGDRGVEDIGVLVLPLGGEIASRPGRRNRRRRLRPAALRRA